MREAEQVPVDQPMDRSLDELIRLGDLDGLVREADLRAARGDWEGLLTLHDGCAAATEELGKQLWGAAQYAAYRLALAAPAEIAASVVTPGAARFALGPLTEVVAQEHTFSGLAPQLSPVVAGAVAQERILRGEDLADDPRAALGDSGLPGTLQPWEPDYVVPIYGPTERHDAGPPAPGAEPTTVSAAPGRPRPLPEVERALTDLVEPWVSQSTGEVHVSAVAGDAAAAAAALIPDQVALAPLTVPEAFAVMAWAGGSGGVHGRRRGGAAGRAAAWWVGHAATGLRFPADVDELEFHLEELDWYAVMDRQQVASWQLRLAVEDPAEGWAVAIDAIDRVDGTDAREEDGHG